MNDLDGPMHNKGLRTDGAEKEAGDGAGYGLTDKDADIVGEATE